MTSLLQFFCFVVQIAPLTAKLQRLKFRQIRRDSINCNKAKKKNLVSYLIKMTFFGKSDAVEGA